MKFEKGKRYTFSDKQFNIGRDSNNRLTFIVPDPNSVQEHRIVAYDFQNQRMPEKITCIFNGNKFEQDPFSVAPLLYKPGECYQFYINSEVRLGRCTLRDEANNVTYKNIYIGKNKHKRFDRITVRIDEIESDNLKLTLMDERQKDEKLFSAEDLVSLPEGRYLRMNRGLEGMLEHPQFKNAAAQLANGNNLWAITFLEESLEAMVEMIKGKVTRKGYLLRGLENIAIALIERSDYVFKLPKEQQLVAQKRLENVALHAGDYWHAYNLMVRREAANTMIGILGSLEKSRRFYNPDEKVRLLNALLELEAVDVNKYMERVLSILVTHHNNTEFMRYFRNGMRELLKQFITRRRHVIGHTDRESLRLFIRALAMEQLLAAGYPDPEIALRRGYLYVVAAMLLNSWDNSLPAKAIQCFAGLVDGPLEFTWLDVNDITRLCYGCLTRPFAQSDLRNAVARHIGPDGLALSVSFSGLSVAPDVNENILKKSLNYQLFPGMQASVLTEDKVSGVSAICDSNPTLQEPKFKEMVRALLSTHVSTKPRKGVSSELMLESGDMVQIYVSSIRDNGIFECRIVDKVYKGTGTMTLRDMVAYDVRPTIADFRNNNKPLLFDAIVKGMNPDGTYQFSIRRTITSHCVQQASYDRDSDTEVLAVITGVYKLPNGYYALSEQGYPMVVWLPKDVNFELRRADMVVAKIVNVNSSEKGNDSENLFIKADYLDFITNDDVDSGAVKRVDVYGVFRHTMLMASNGEVFEGNASPDNSQSSDERPLVPMSSEGADLIARTINLMSGIDDTNLARQYTMVAISQILAQALGNTHLTGLLSAKQDALEALGQFASISRIDSKTLDNIIQYPAAFRHEDVALDTTIELLQILSGLDNPEEIVGGNYPENSITDSISRLVNAYNLLYGMGLADARRGILEGIYTLLRLPQPDMIDVIRLKVQEDEHNEFKESLIYPANNNMKADDRVQGREIMEIVCGMLNHKGGTIYLGVNNQGVPVGLDADFCYLNNNSHRYDLRDMEDKFSLNFHWHLRNQIGNTYEGRPLTDFVKLSFDSLDDNKVTGRVTVEAYPGMVRMRDGLVFIRQDSSTIPLAQREQAAFAARRAKNLE